MSGPLLYGRDIQEVLIYVARREHEIAAEHPRLFRALSFYRLALDQREALCQSLESIRIIATITEETVKRALANPADPRDEAEHFDPKKWGTAEMTIARVVGGDRSRRDEVRKRFGLAARIIRLASSQ